MKRINQLLDIVHKKNNKEAYDTVYIVAGDEGTGKSTLVLNILEDYLNRNGGCKEEDIKFIALDKMQFANALKETRKGGIICYDEAGDISNKRTMSNFNVMLTQAYQVIRGDNLFTILVLPSIWDLDSFFTKRRARGVFYVYKRGRVAFWGKDELRKMIEINQYRMIKNPWVVKPLFYDTYPKYKGLLASSYDKKKQAKMDKIRRELYLKIKGEAENSLLSRDKKRKEIAEYSKTHTIKETADKYKLTKRSVYNYRKMFNIENESE